MSTQSPTANGPDQGPDEPFDREKNWSPGEPDEMSDREGIDNEDDAEFDEDDTNPTPA